MRGTKGAVVLLTRVFLCCFITYSASPDASSSFSPSQRRKFNKLHTLLLSAAMASLTSSTTVV